MPDFQAVAAPSPQKTMVSTMGTNALGLDCAVAQGLLATAGIAWPAANRALYVTVWLEQTMTAKRLFCFPTTASGNLDMGIYDAQGNRIVSKGSTAVGTANACQVIDITASVTGTASPVLPPGMYFLALNVDNTTAALKAATQTAAEMCRICGVQQQAVGAVTLPNPATFANPASAYFPFIGMSSATI